MSLVALEDLDPPYGALAQVYDRWTSTNAYDQWAGFIGDRLTAAGIEAGAYVLDVCCGTGSMGMRLRKRGYLVSGVDGSAAMLDLARESLGPGADLHRLTLPADLPFAAGSFDAAVCCFDSVNYFAPSALDSFFAAVAPVVRPWGLFIFDVNTRRKLEEVFGCTHYGDDLGDFAYVWRNRYHAEERSIDFLVSLFTRTSDGFRRDEEHHRQWWFDHDSIRASTGQAGFAVVAVTSDYTTADLDPESLRETWVLRRN